MLVVSLLRQQTRSWASWSTSVLLALAVRRPVFASHSLQRITIFLVSPGLYFSNHSTCNVQPFFLTRVLVPFPHLAGEEAPSPYVGVIDLREGLRHQKHPGLFPVPAAGLLQLVLCNPEKTGVKVFAIKYDFRTMPANTHTFLRQRTHVSSAAGTRGALRYAAHVRFVSSKRGQLYLYQDIRLIFAHRAPDVTEHQLTTTEGPSDPVFTPCDALTARASPSKRGSDEELNDSGIRTSPEVVPIPMAPLESA